MLKKTLLFLLTFVLLSCSQQNSSFTVANYNFYDDVNTNGYVEIWGTWLLDEYEDKKNKLPPDSTKIICKKEIGYCFEARVLLLTSGHLTIMPDVWKIEAWNNTAITAINSNYPLIKSCIKINRLSKTAITYTPVNSGSCQTTTQPINDIKLVDWYTGSIPNIKEIISMRTY